jgi:hypothetical protein
MSSIGGCTTKVPHRVPCSELTLCGSTIDGAGIGFSGVGLRFGVHTSRQLVLLENFISQSGHPSLSSFHPISSSSSRAFPIRTATASYLPTTAAPLPSSQRFSTKGSMSAEKTITGTAGMSFLRIRASSPRFLWVMERLVTIRAGWRAVVVLFRWPRSHFRPVRRLHSLPHE